MLTELWSELSHRLRALLHRAELERELDDELRFHLEREIEKLVAQGLPPDEARRQAALAFGGIDRFKEESRDTRGTRFIETFLQDVRYAWRGLRARPALTTGVVLTLGLGIGANAAMFTVVDRLLLRPPAFLRDPSHVHRVYLRRTRERVTRIDDGYQFPRYRDLVRWSHGIADAAAFVSWRLAVGDGESARVRQVVGASASYFDFFDAQPALGRFYSPSEDSVPAGAPVAVLGYAFWQSEYDGRQDVLGQTLRVDHTLCTIIGVAPPGFRGMDEHEDPAVYIPVTTFGMDERGPGYVTNYSFHWLSAIVRRKAEVDVAALTADMTAAVERSWLAEAAVEPGLQPLAAARPAVVLGPVQSARGPVAGADAKVALWTGGVTVIVLLIACANVANLLLARALGRRREIALRRALGVTTPRLVQQLLTECLLLAALGGILGMVVAQVGGGVLRRLFLPGDVVGAVLSDTRTLLVTLLATLLAALLTSLAPVLHATRSSLSHTLAGGGRDTGPRSSRGRAALLVFQATLSVVLLVGAGLFVRSLEHVRALRLGFDVDPLLVVTDNSRGVKQTPAERLALENRLVEAARSMPGVSGASIVSSIPFWGFEGRDLFVAGVDSVDHLGNFDLQAVNPDYFHTMGTRLLRGRAFDDHDNATAPRVIVVSLGMARALWPGQEPLGKCIRIASRDSSCATVVGVSEDLRLHTLTDPREYMYYVPIAQHGEPEGMLVVRVGGHAVGSVEAVRQRLQREMPGASYVTVQPLSDMVDPETRSWRIGTTMFVAFGTLALVLAAVGLYGVIAYDVAQRRREIGVRLALGASRGEMVRLVMTGGVRLVALGLVLGSLIALSTRHAVAELLFQERPTDPAVYLTVSLLLLAVALVATLMPGLAASRVDPSIALRAE